MAKIDRVRAFTESVVEADIVACEPAAGGDDRDDRDAIWECRLR